MTIRIQTLGLAGISAVLRQRQAGQVLGALGPELLSWLLQWSVHRAALRPTARTVSRLMLSALLADSETAILREGALG